MMQAMLFIEESGGLLERIEQESGLDAIRIRQGCLAALRRFQDAGFGLVLLIDPADPAAAARAPMRDSLDAFIDALLGSETLRLAARRTCPHAAGTGCDCALPGIGLVDDYLADPALDRTRSLVVGDRSETLGLARAMGISAASPVGTRGWEDIARDALDQPRRARVRRKTRETEITVAVDLDRAAEPVVSTGIGFFDHMLEQLGKHGGFGLEVRCSGDLEVDEHHTVEDVALAIGQALRQALGDKLGIARYGFLLAMDEAEAQVAVDLSGRAFAVFEGAFPRDSVGGLPTELVPHFFRSLSETLGAALHVAVRGDNAHHMVEACFKGVARAFRQAFARSGADLPSTKGIL